MSQVLRSLSGRKGGKRATLVQSPGEVEGLALAVGAAMMYASRRSVADPDFYTKISSEVKRVGASEQEWNHTQMYAFVQEKLFNGLPQQTIVKCLERRFAMPVFASEEDKVRVRAERPTLLHGFIADTLYLYLSRVPSGVDYSQAKTLCLRVRVWCAPSFPPALHPTCVHAISGEAAGVAHRATDWGQA